jgi:hypothetical protein
MAASQSTSQSKLQIHLMGMVLRCTLLFPWRVSIKTLVTLVNQQRSSNKSACWQRVIKREISYRRLQLHSLLLKLCLKLLLLCRLRSQLHLLLLQ